MTWKFYAHDEYKFKQNSHGMQNCHSTYLPHPCWFPYFFRHPTVECQCHCWLLKHGIKKSLNFNEYHSIHGASKCLWCDNFQHRCKTWKWKSYQCNWSCHHFSPPCKSPEIYHTFWNVILPGKFSQQNYIGHMNWDPKII